MSRFTKGAGPATTEVVPKILGTDEEWEPGGRLGNDERYARAVNDPEVERQIDKAVGVRRRRNQLK